MISILGTIIFSLVTVTVLFIAIINYQYSNNVKEDLRRNNELMMKMIKMKQGLENVDALKIYHNSDIRVTLINEKGKVLYDSVSDWETMDNHNNRDEVIAARTKGTGYSIRFSHTIQKNMMYCASAFGEGYILRSATSTSLISVFERAYIRYYLVTLCFVFLITAWLTSRLSHFIVKPIKDLQYFTSRVARGELHRRIKITSKDEISELGKTFNDMADRLQSTLGEMYDKQNRLEAILKSMESGVIAVDRNNKIIMINPYAEEIFGIRRDIIGENLMDHIRDFELQNIFEHNQDQSKEIKLHWPKERELRVRTADIINGYEHIGTVAVVQDITDIKRLENIRSQFVANVSHELKTPLTSIKGFAETLKYVEDTVTKDKFLNIINDEAERLTRLINDILILSDIENNREVKMEPVNINQAVRDVYYLMKNTADAKNITLTLQGGDVPPISGTEDKVKQMLINLVDNAVKYSENGDRVYIGTEIENEACILWVEDTGPGIPKEHIPRLFERFYRVDKARSRAKGGTGLGLAIVKHIVLGLNGTIEVKSELGIGSKFTVRIPLMKQ